MDSDTLYKQVQEHYGAVARGTQPVSSGAIAQAFGYSEGELNSITRDANLGLSCGNPLAIASLREGETVIDLGSGAGFDVFLAANKVGPQGRVIGIDMNQDMLARARTNQAKQGIGKHVSFVDGRITSIPLENGNADCIISNCVINLVPEDEKPAAFVEMARLLKSGGRLAISDTLSRKPFPHGLRQSVGAYVGCVAGCSPKEDYERFLTESGFRDILIVDTNSDLNVYKLAGAAGCGATKCCAPASDNPKVKQSSCCSSNDQNGSSAEGEVASETASWSLEDIDINEWVGSFHIYAVKA